MNQRRLFCLKHFWPFLCYAIREWRCTPLRLYLASCALGLLAVSSLPAQVVISQVYGGGGNNGALLKNDYVELFNRSPIPVDFSGWSLQYASGNGATWQKVELRGTLSPGAYYLVQLAAGGGGSLNLPDPDAFGGIPMSASSGKVALLSVSRLTPKGTVCPEGEAVVDLIGYGVGTGCHENAPIPSTGNSIAAFRKDGGCRQSGENRADFMPGEPNPRNRATPHRVCGETVARAGDAAPGVPMQAAKAARAYSWRVSPEATPTTVERRSSRTRRSW